MYECSIPVFIRYLDILSTILEKGARYGSAHEIEESVLLGSRLFPDMLPLSRQVQIVSDVLKGAAARLSDIEAPKFEDTEVSFAELQTRIENTKLFLQSVPEGKINDTEDKKIVLQAGAREFELTGRSFLTAWALPNLFFHVTTTYNILRHNGVELGKMDFLGGGTTS